MTKNYPIQMSFTAAKKASDTVIQGRIAWWLTGAWVLTMIAIPIVRWTVGDVALPWGVLLSVGLLALAVITALGQHWGWRPTMGVVAVIAPFAWGLEWLGSTTGLPFGVYHYTETLQPQLAGVPLVIPFAWFMMLPPAWAVASYLTSGRMGSRFVLLSAAAFTAWDLFLDPQMVAWGYWVWAEPGGYFGIPWINFGGWFLGATLLTLLVLPRLRAGGLPQPLLLIIYAITWFLQSIGQLFFWQMPGPALCGSLGMGFFLLLAYLRTTR
ncbi:MAG: carotenoid biosynthesis protein [Caldilineaceae bacterium]|nr:carotenoid biosynthesis protein [Caldilineaceae bacterium]